MNLASAQQLSQELEAAIHLEARAPAIEMGRSMVAAEVVTEATVTVGQVGREEPQATTTMAGLMDMDRAMGEAHMVMYILGADQGQMMDQDRRADQTKAALTMVQE